MQDRAVGRLAHTMLGWPARKTSTVYSSMQRFSHFSCHLIPLRVPSAKQAAKHALFRKLHALRVAEIAKRRPLQDAQRVSFAPETRRASGHPLTSSSGQGSHQLIGFFWPAAWRVHGNS